MACLATKQNHNRIIRGEKKNLECLPFGLRFFINYVGFAGGIKRARSAHTSFQPAMATGIFASSKLSMQNEWAYPFAMESNEL